MSQLTLLGNPASVALVTSEMKGDGDRYRAQSALCLRAARVTIAPGLAAEFDRLAQRWLKMASEPERPNTTESDRKARLK